MTSTVTHRTGCPSTATGGAKGLCLCIGDRPFAVRPAPARFQLAPRQPEAGETRTGDSHRKARDRRSPTTGERRAASTALAIAGKKWLDAYLWATSTGRDGADLLYRTAIHPATVTAYLATLEN